MTANDFIECLLKSGNVEITLNADDLRQIVEGTARLQLIEKPEALLRERNRKNVAGCFCVSHPFVLSWPQSKTLALPLA